MRYNKKYMQHIARYEQNKANRRRTLVALRGATTVLDVGCGNGYLARYLTAKGKKVTAVDISPYAGTVFPHFIVDATKSLPFPDKSFDAVVANDFFEHLTGEEIEKAYKEMVRVGKRVIARIGVKQERHSGNTHQTVEPLRWWQSHFPQLTIIR